MTTQNDDQRIFQALSTEMERLQRAFNNGKVDAETVSHCSSLRDRYAAIISGPNGPIETGDVVRVLTLNGEVGYLGVVVGIPDGKYAVETPDEEIHYPTQGLVERATEAESDDYIDRYES